MHRLTRRLIADIQDEAGNRIIDRITLAACLVDVSPVLPCFDDPLPGVSWEVKYLNRQRARGQMVCKGLFAGEERARYLAERVAREAGKYFLHNNAIHVCSQGNLRATSLTQL